MKDITSKELFRDLFSFAILWDLGDKITFEKPEHFIITMSYVVLITLRFAYSKYAEHFFKIISLIFVSFHLFKFPLVSNHANVSLFFLLLYHFAKEDQFIPGAKLLLTIVYFLTGFHKLNWDFLSVEHSCSTWAFNKFANNFHLSKGFVPDFIQIVSPYVVLLLELVGPIIIWFRHTRVIGLVAFLGLHLFLSLIGFSDFASIALCVLVFFSSDKVISRLKTFLYDKKIGQWMAISWVYFYFMGMSLLTLFLNDVLILDVRIISALHGVMFNLLFLFLLFGLKFYGKEHDHKELRSNKLGGVPIALAIFTIFYGLQNYFGLNTAANFSMFSNILTEAPYSNHLLLANKPLKIFFFQDDLLEVVESDRLDLLNTFCRALSPIDQTVVPEPSFQRCARRLKEFHPNDKFYVVLRINGETQRYDNFLQSSYFDRPYPWYYRWLIFRPLYKGRQYCAW